MKKDKAWLIQKVSDIFWRVEIDGNFNIQNANIMFDDISNLIDELDEPQKPVVPQFVADYIEYYKGTGITLGTWFNFVNEDEFERKTEEWIYSGSYEENLKREYLLIDAIRYGYEVEKEKRYYVKIQSQFLCVGKYLKGFIALRHHEDINTAEKCEFTEQEIKAIDERYWAFAEEVTE
ncbi:MAG TPA: DUF1642 domain-containing protein [Candidatus Jeotgalibaca merdavium]|uniref:DUF1642 domain-containing protein n=1 Tax=Candidatus Jeotgalibaca merdavium TaxID=2838627 RepID=A0A9D2KYH7_9LACT|nr:DUF1642 domain-containing protein [Candidatus Jeotgalibaca merdavium]